MENLPLEEALTVTFVRSYLAAARLAAVDGSAAAELPGVQVLTASDIDVAPLAPPVRLRAASRCANPEVGDMRSAIGSAYAD